MKRLEFSVTGVPGAQGSKRHVGRGVMVESSKKVKPWRRAVVLAGLKAIEDWEREYGCTWEPFDGPVTVGARFMFARPKHHYGTGRNADVLRPNAPHLVISRAAGDIDKLLRSTFDALTTAKVWNDDGLAAQLGGVSKAYGTWPGAYITITEAL